MNLSRLVSSGWSSSAVAQKLIRLAYPFNAKRVIRRGALRGQTVTIGPGMGFTYIWNLDSDGWAWVKRIPRGSVVYDVGANCGQSTLHLAAAVGHTGRVVAFEPVRQVFEQMTANVEANGLSQVTPVCAAASNVDGTAQFAFNADDPTVGRLSADEASTDLAHPVMMPVTVVRLDSYKEHGWPAPSFLKIDVEGGARAVFEGARELLSLHRPTFFMEMHSADEQAALKEVMRVHRYRATHPVLGDIPDPTVGWASPLYCEPL